MPISKRQNLRKRLKHFEKKQKKILKLSERLKFNEQLNSRSVSLRREYVDYKIGHCYL